LLGKKVIVRQKYRLRKINSKSGGIVTVTIKL
jgi:hypothetical protein